MLDGGAQRTNNPTVFVINVDPEQQEGSGIDQNVRCSWFYRAVACLRDACCKCLVPRPDTLQLLTSERSLRVELRVNALEAGELSNRVRVELNSPDIVEVLSSAESMGRRERTVFQREVILNILTTIRERGNESVETTNAPDEAQLVALERLQELKSNVVPYDDLLKYTPELDELDAAKECCLSEENTDDIVFHGKHFYSYNVLEKNYLGRNGLDPFDMESAIDWSKVYRVVLPSQKVTDISSAKKGADNAGFELNEVQDSDLSTGTTNL